MEEPLEEVYFNWLCAKVLVQEMRGTSNYLDLLRILHKTEYTWSILGDKNRYDDGIELREYFLGETGFLSECDWWEAPCSLLEFFIAFSDRASFQSDEPVFTWFWRFMSHLQLDDYRQVQRSDEAIIEERLHTFVSREYRPDGHGGIFPMYRPKKDQRDVEIWYQFCAWVDENGII